MKRILILIIGLFGVANAQYAPTSAKTKFVNGLSIGSKDSTYFTNAGDTIVLYFGRDSAVYARYKGYHKRLAYAGGADFVPYNGAVTNVDLGAYRLTARSVKTDSIYANSSAGMYLTTNIGNVVAHWGAGGSVEVDFKGFAGYDANRASSYTARSFTDKNYVDSSDALRVRYTDTAAMLAPFIQYSDTTGLYSQVVRTFGTQTIGGAKTFSSDITVNSMRVGLGGGGQTQNVALGLASLNSNTTGTFNTSIGFQSLFDNTTAVNNTAVGSQSLANLTTGSNNIGIGANAGSISAGAADLTTNTNSIFLGSNTKASANGNTNEIVIGDNTTGNGSNTVTIGNSSITNTYLKGVINGTSLSMSGGGTFGGDIGIGITPSTGGLSGYRLVEIGNGGNSIYSGINQSLIGTNISWSGSTANYKTSNAASLYNQQSGRHEWYTASSGTAGNPITFSEAARIASDGTFLINTTTTDGTNKLIVNGGVKFGTGGTTTITAAGAATFSSSVTGTILTGNSYVLGGYLQASGTTGLLVLTPSDWGTSSEIRNNTTINGASGGDYLSFKNPTGKGFSWTVNGSSVANLSSTGAATFSSSVTASSFIRSGGTSTQALMADGSIQSVTSATYTPTLSGVTNINSITLDKASYTRVGAIITVYVSGTVSTTAAGGSAFSITAPLQPIGSSVIGNGTVNNGTSDGASGYVSPSSTSVVQFNWNSINTTSRTFSLSFQYSL